MPTQEENEQEYLETIKNSIEAHKMKREGLNKENALKACKTLGSSLKESLKIASENIEKRIAEVLEFMEINPFDLSFYPVPAYYIDFDKIVVRVLCHNYADDDVLNPEEEEIEIPIKGLTMTKNELSEAKKEYYEERRKRREEEIKLWKEREEKKAF
jgi:hypothetical protein